MDNTQLKDIAIGALTNHWPAHLGLTTDAERIEWLARWVERLCDEAVDTEKLEDRVDIAEEERDAARDDVDDRKACDDCTLCDEHRKAEDRPTP